NYDYLIEPPIFKDIACQMPQVIYSLIAIMAFNLFILVFHIITVALQNRKAKKQLEPIGISDV
ncbi:MAG TPA: hypothetical protein VFD08_05045, partial [Clostridia bacterium]|nr:hypothetical protein [Clostridia bacterium]